MTYIFENSDFSKTGQNYVLFDGGYWGQISTLRAKFSYPPKDCADAVRVINTLTDRIKDLNERVASGIKLKDVEAELKATQDIKSIYQDYINAANCVQQAIQAEDTAFSNQLTAALDKEKDSEASGKKANNWLLFGSIGILIVGAVIIFLKKRKN